LSQKLVDLAAGRIKRLIIEMPPRSGKSELASHWFPVWYLRQWPDREIILASYEADFAAKWGRKTRNSILENGDKLKIQLSPDSQATNRWETTMGGGMVTAGVGGPITGRGAHLLIVDDPIKNQEEAFSEVYREKTWDWFRSTAYTRLEPGGVAVLIMTRWHNDDLAGRLIREMENGGEKWEVICFPAVAEVDDDIGRFTGEALWPERFNLDALGQIKNAVGSRIWFSMYQQRPTPLEGAVFQREWFKIADKGPAVYPRVRFWDFAATEAKGKSDPDWTAGALVSVIDGQWWVYDIRRIRGTPKSVEDLVVQTAQIDSNLTQIWIEQEPGSSGIHTIDYYQRSVLVGYPVQGLRTTGPKILRAQPMSAAAEAGNVFLVNGSWVNDFLDEVEAFPAGAHDDQVDAVSGAFTVLGAAEQGWELPYQSDDRWGHIPQGDRRDLSNFAMTKKEKEPWDMEY
jgi:predicted phage terminase large subunit-like protein